MNSLRRTLAFVRPYRWTVALLVLTSILPVTMELIVPRQLQLVIDDGIRPREMDVILRGSMIMFGAALMGALATLGQGYCRAYLSQGLAYDMRNALFRHIESFSFSNLDHLKTGQLMTRISSDVDVVRMFSSNGLSLLLRASLMVIGSLVLVIITDWQLSLVMIAVLLLAGILIWNLMRRARPIFMTVQQELADLNTIVQENLAGVQVVKAFVREPYENERFEQSSVSFMEQNIKVGRLMAVAIPVLTLLTNVGLVAVLWQGGSDVIGGRLSVGELVAFNSYLMIGMTPLLLLGNVLTMVSRAEASAERVLEVLATEPAVRSAPAAAPLAQAANRITFDRVSFQYNNRGGEVLKEITFDVTGGQHIALLGATGAGKSTLVNLIPRFYDVTGGSIRINGTDVRNLRLEELRAQTGVVLQETILFGGTVRDNIAYGRPDASLKQVIAAATAAQAHDFILAMPGGYDAVVEAGGANLSGGQRQRIAIARALLTDPDILILDDCTSAVDLETEARIQDALEELKNGRTVFVVAQRISSVLAADQILILDGGQVAARGTHRELMQTSPIYREIYQSQLGGAMPVDAASKESAGGE